MYICVEKIYIFDCMLFILYYTYIYIYIYNKIRIIYSPENTFLYAYIILYIMHIFTLVD